MDLPRRHPGLLRSMVAGFLKWASRNRSRWTPCHLLTSSLRSQRSSSTKETMLSNCGAGEDSWESLGQQGAQTKHSWRKPTLTILWKDWSWSSNTLATWREELNHWERPWCWERLKAKRRKGGRGWDGWMASLTQWTCVWANLGRQQRTGKPSVLQFMGLQRIGHDLATEQQNSEIYSVTSKVVTTHSPRFKDRKYRFYHFFFNLFFNWRKIALQCCVGFFHITTKISHNYISFLLSFPPHPIPRSSQNARGTTEKKEKILPLDGRTVSHIVRGACGRADSVMAIFGKYHLPTQPHKTHSIPKQFVSAKWGNSIPLAIYLYRDWQA